ncbi:hypothetical protein GA0070609_3213 [Micromonospora echinaurantiaca]|uniref:GPR1/FUN34/yaaH family protein n=1 Tax=Micromonospora echinaurantiaca TaxID=47857 RepID=A0A1C5IFU7_9ACTN|nr:hypothetical protein [Micromonospora echinaurantiaca]SCG56881.1 hypothetical protein GA0070609_3213 [Micromonospora echinaurantiaca]
MSSTSSDAQTAEDGKRPAVARHFEPDLRPMTRINLRPIASPMPLGFYTIAIASAIASLLQLGLFDATDERAVALTILPAFALQLVVSVLAFGARDVVAATLMAVFAGSWLATSLVLATDASGGMKVLGVLNLSLAAFAGLMVTVTMPKRALWFVLLIATPRHLVAGIYGLTGVAWLGHVAGALGLLLAGFCLYAAYALMLEDMKDEQILPIGRTGPAHAAVEGNLAVQLRNLERRAGVRRTL